MTRSGLTITDMDEENNWPRGRLFRIFAAAMVGIIVAGATPRINAAMADAGVAVTAGSLLLIGMGLLHLGLTANILRITISLMTILSGFEIIYAAVEGSVVVLALLAVIILGLALVGSYLMLASNAKEAESA
jgi:sulfite exporter TauE/SafE